MKFNKHHFSYSKSQRNGVFLLMIIVVVLQVTLLLFKKYNNKVDLVVTQNEIIQKQLDSLFALSKKNKYKLKPFNPNYLSDYKAYQLGMSVQEIDKLIAFRKTEKYVNSVKEFQEVTSVSDSLLNIISPYFKFPSWIHKSKKKKTESKSLKIIVKDINKATMSDLRIVSGIGEKRAETILKYRKLLQGFSQDNQLDEVWGITPDVLKQLKKEFKVLSKPKIEKLNVNEVTQNQLSKIVYIDYKLARSIIEYRREVAEIQNLAELKIIRDFPKDKFNLISLYLRAY